jgi:two-component system, chemotaxis family, chemotaxis protein CheY
MINLDDEVATEYLAECGDHLATIETGLRALEIGGMEVDEQLVNRIFRAVHAVRGAGFFELLTIRELAHQIEDVLTLVRAGKMAPAPDTIRVLLRANDRLRELIQSPGTSNEADIDDMLAALALLSAELPPSAEKGYSSATGPRESRQLRTLLVEDDFASRLVLQTFLSRYGDCHIAVNGKEAVEAFRYALEGQERYDLICMDIMMPEMDGCEAVRRVRAMEEARGIFSASGVKIIMTTTVHDIKEVIRCFKELCDAYLMKPIDLGELLSHMRSYQLVR